jgi:hypothetical protein
MGDVGVARSEPACVSTTTRTSLPTHAFAFCRAWKTSLCRPIGVPRKLAEGEGFEPPRGLRPGGFQVRCLTS